MSDNEQIIRELKKGLIQAQDTLREYEDFIAQLRDGSLQKGTFLRTSVLSPGASPQIIVQTTDGTVAAPIAPAMRNNNWDALEPGLTVWLSNESGAVCAMSQPEPNIESKVVSIEADKIYVSANGEAPRLAVSTSTLRQTLSVGDSVLLDAFEAVVIRKISRKQSFTVMPENVEWSDIGGLEDAKREMIEAIEMPLTHKEIFARYGKKPTKGILLYGPPGCGKTMLGKAASTAVSRLFRNTKTPGFFYIKGPEVLSKWVGETESTIRALFDKAREFKKQSGAPAVIFIDEAESLLHRRQAMEGSDNMSMTIVPTFLAEMDGLDDSGAMVLLSTNRPDTLDPAIVRDGRIDRKIHVSRPSQQDTQDIFQKYLKKIPTANKELAGTLAEEVFHDKFAFYDIALRSGDVKKFALRNIVSGAMVSGIIEHAISLAMHREIQKQGKGGVCKDDLFGAVHKSFHQNRDMSHDTDLKVFVEPFKSDVVNIQRSMN
jgi:proteasome-associated ATPase